jgi:hypothetical protein
MSNVLGSIFVELKANTTAYVAGMGKAGYASKQAGKNIRESFEGLSGVLSSVLGPLGAIGPAIAETFSKVGTLSGSAAAQVGNFGGALGSVGVIGGIALGALGGAAVAAATGLAEMAKQGAEIVERFSLISQKTGISIRDLQGFEATGKTVGVSLEDMVTSMRKFDSALAGVGKNAAAGALLRELGVTAKTNKEALLQAADAFKAMEDGPEKAALAVQLFGKAGLNMIPFLNKGAEGMKEFNALVDKFGPKIGKEAVEANERYKQSTVQLDLEWQHFKVTIEQGVLPVITKLNSIDWSEKWAGFKGALSGGPIGAMKAMLDLQAARALAAAEAHKEADAEEAKRSSLEKQVALQEEVFSKLKAGGSAAYALEQAREKMTAEIAVHHFDAATTIFNSLPGLQKAAELEAKRAVEAKRVAASYASVIASLGQPVKPLLQIPTADPTKGIESLFGKQPGKNILDSAPDLGQSAAISSVKELSDLFKPVLSKAQEAINSFNDDWDKKSAGTAEKVIEQHKKEYLQFAAYLDLGEVSQQQFNDFRQKNEADLQEKLKQLRKDTGASTFHDAWQDMFLTIENSGRDFARSITSDIGDAIQGLTEQLAKFIATGQGLNLKQLGQSLETNIVSSVLKKGESSLFGSLGLGRGKADGSSSAPFYVTPVDGSGKSLLGGIGGGAGKFAGIPAGDGDAATGGITSGIQNLFSSLTSKIGSIFSNIGSMFSSIFSSIAGGLGGIGSFFGKILGSFGGGMASGGDVSPGKFYVVGEQHPEFFAPKTRGSIVPQLNSARGDQSVVMQLHIHGVTDVDSFKQSQQQIYAGIHATAAAAFARTRG